MKKLIALVLAISLFNCKNETKQTAKVIQETVKNSMAKISKKIYPDNVSNVFKAHGTLETWNSFKSLSFTINKPKNYELTITDLKNRYSYIETNTFKLGYNGTDVWLQENKGFTYDGNPNFYYNLMFYFYAMPFVLGDSGITYQNVDALQYEGKSYPGIKISYENNIGESPEDEYILYYDTDTNKMIWLAYTVTYFTKEKSKEWHFIRYTDWQNVNGLLLPKTLSWYKANGFKIGEKRNDLEFIDIKLSKEKMESSIFKKPLK